VGLRGGRRGALLTQGQGRGRFRADAGGDCGFGVPGGRLRGQDQGATSRGSFSPPSSSETEVERSRPATTGEKNLNTSSSAPPPSPSISNNKKKQYYQPSRSDRYACWGLSQARYLLGDGGRSFVAGFGEKPPVSVQDEAASCPRRPAACDAVSAQLTPSPNPWVMPGALVDGPSTLSDLLPDVRPLNSSRVHLVNSAALYAAAAGAAESRVRWEVCLQGFGVLSKDTLLCGKGDKGL